LPKFEECLQRHEAIVKEMERGDLPLEQSLKLFEEGIALSDACRKELDEAEGKIEDCSSGRSPRPISLTIASSLCRHSSNFGKPSPDE